MTEKKSTVKILLHVANGGSNVHRKKRKIKPPPAYR